MKLLNIKQTVTRLLIEKPATKDNDQLLIIEVWKVKNFHLINEPLINFLDDVTSGKYPSPESIRRTRQKLQQHNPELRGSSYVIRTTKEEQETRDELSMPEWKKGGAP